eukprot:scaffold11620_cov119-Isochrysis_galbana.AAC.7
MEELPPKPARATMYSTRRCASLRLSAACAPSDDPTEAPTATATAVAIGMDPARESAETSTAGAAEQTAVPCTRWCDRSVLTVR